MVPETRITSPARAAERNRAWPFGTQPIRVALAVIGPGVEVVSPPMRFKPNRAWSSARPWAKASRSAQPQRLGHATARNQPQGSAPLAARSDRLTRRSLRATRSSGSEGRKCTPSTIMSLVTIRSKPGRAGIAAASSSRPRASGAPPVSGFISRAMKSNSSTPAVASDPVVTGYAVQGGVDEAGLGALEERLGDLDIFVDRHLGGHVRPAGQFEGAG